MQVASPGTVRQGVEPESCTPEPPSEMTAVIEMEPGPAWNQPVPLESSAWAMAGAATTGALLSMLSEPLFAVWLPALSLSVTVNGHCPSKPAGKVSVAKSTDTEKVPLENVPACVRPPAEVLVSVTLPTPLCASVAGPVIITVPVMPCQLVSAMMPSEGAMASICSTWVGRPERDGATLPS